LRMLSPYKLLAIYVLGEFVLLKTRRLENANMLIPCDVIVPK